MDTDSDDEPMFPYNSENNMSSIFNYEDQLHTSPLLRAILASDIEIIKAQIESGRDLNIPNNYGHTPLHAAAIQKSPEILKLLLQLPDININCKNDMGDTPLLLSMKMHQPDAFIMNFLEAGCDVNIADNTDEAPLHLAVARPSTCIALDLIKRGADINAVDGNIYTPLRHAVAADNLEQVCMLLYYNADVNISCYNNLTPFMYAVNDIDKLEITWVLFNYYADFSCITTDGYSALLLAANSMSPIAIDIVNAGADVNFISPSGDSVLLFALHYNNSELFKAVWPKFDHKNVLYTHEPFLLSFINVGHFSTSDWVQCLYGILNSPIIDDLLAQYSNYVTPYGFISLFGNLMLAMFKRKVELGDRLAIIQILLSFGATVTAYDVNITSSLYGYNEELESFIYCGNPSEIGFRLYDMYCLRPAFIFVGEEDYSSKYIVKLLQHQLSLYFSFIKVPISILYPIIEDIIKTIGCFSFSYKMKRALRTAKLPTSCKDEIVQKLSFAPEFPSLVELSRNEIRKSIHRNNNIKLPYHFHHAVNTLEIPLFMKNIILFKVPIYT